MEFKKLIGNTYCASVGAALIGIYLPGDGTAVLIDTGYREYPELLDELAARRLTVPAAICTHMHVDHTANNRLLAERWGTVFYTGRDEAENLQLRVFGEDESGLLARMCPENLRPIEGGAVTIGGARFTELPLPGHSIGHIGVVTPDGVCCVGDAIMTERLLRMSKMPYMLDADTSIESMERLRGTRCPLYLAAHKGIVPPEELPGLLDMNIEKELDLYRALLALSKEPVEAEELVTRLMDSLGVTRLKGHFLQVFREATRNRIRSLARAGEVREEGGIIYPV